MNILQSLLYKIQPPISFTAELSELETRMTLKELCDSVWDDCDFSGEVSQNSFSFLKKRRAHTKGIPHIALDGEFHEENGRTLVTVRPKIPFYDSPGGILSFLLGGILLFLGLMGIPFVLTDPSSLFASAFMAVFGAAILAVEYGMISVGFRKSVEALKNVLISSERNQRERRST